VLIALANSVIAVLIWSMNAATRMWYRMARVGLLPSWLGYVHPRFKTPSNAIIAQIVLSLVLAFVLSAAWGVSNVFSVLGFLFIFGAIPVYIVANYSVFRLYWTEHRPEFNLFLHVIVPDHRHRRAALVRLQVGGAAAAVAQWLGGPADHRMVRCRRGHRALAAGPRQRAGATREGRPSLRRNCPSQRVERFGADLFRRPVSASEATKAGFRLP
jgi:hypothetical protein